MEKKYSKFKFWECLRCKYVWISNAKLKGIKPKFCPNCKSPYWDIPRKRKINTLILSSIIKRL
jgi:hypothetical protein